MDPYDLLSEIIKEYNIIGNEEKTIKKINSLFYLFPDDTNKSLALQYIINNLKNTFIFINLFDNILNYRKCFIEEDIFFDTLSKTGAISILLNKYKKYINLLDNPNLSNDELKKIDTLMKCLDTLKSFALNDELKAPMKNNKPYAKTKIIKRLKNLDLKFNELLEKINIEDINDYQGIIFHITQIRSDVDFYYSTNDKKFIKYYLETTNLDRKQLYSDPFITYIMSNTDNISFIKEMQQLIQKKYRNYFRQIKLEQLSLIKQVNQFDLSSINRYCHNAILTNDVININLANILIRKHLLSEITLTKSTLINCLKSLILEYIKTFNLPENALIIHKKRELGNVNGYYNYINQIIGINENGMDEFIKFQDIGLINTLFHELTHAYQMIKMENYNDYMIKKETLISNYYSIFYQKNYWHIYGEIDARSNGAIETFRYLKNIVPSLVKDYEREYIEQIELENNNLSTAAAKKSPYKKEYGLESVSDIFEQLVHKHPGIIKRNEIFKLEFNLDGTKKTLREMLENYSNLNQKEKIILKEILKNKILTDVNDEIIKEIESITNINNEIYWYCLKMLTTKHFQKTDETTKKTR